MKVYSKEELATGLTGEEVQSRIRDGLVNGDTEVPTKSVPAIIKGNIVNLFNILNFILAGLLLILSLIHISGFPAHRYPQTLWRT